MAIRIRKLTSDDLPQIDNYEKVALIGQLGPVHYIHVLPFYGFKNEELTATLIGDVANSIRKD